MYDRSLVNCVNNIAQINNDCVPMHMTSPEGMKKHHDIPMSKFSPLLTTQCSLFIEIFHHQVLISTEVTEALPQTPPAPPPVLSPALSPALTPSPHAPGPRGRGPRAPPGRGRPALRNPRPV